MDPNVKKACAGCHSDKPRSEYYKKQWKKSSGQGLCSLCWDERLRNGSATPKKRKAVADIQQQTKRQTVTPKKRKKPKKQKAIADALAGIQSQKMRVMSDFEKYFLSPGVSYEFWDDSPSCELKYRQKKLENKELEGKYDLVFYATSRICCDDQDVESVHRTATGKMEVWIDEWGGKPALVGNFSLNSTAPGTLFHDYDYYDCNGRGHLINQMDGDWTSGGIAEMVTDEKAYMECNGMNVIDNGSPEYEKMFLLKRDCYGGGRRRWYEGAELEEDLLDDYCGAKISIVANKAALGLSFDHYHDFTPEYQGIKPRDLKHAEELFDDHQTGRRFSWITNHLGLPSNVASVVGKFVTPPPVFFVQPGDLVLEVEESREPEWQKYFLFRKSSPGA